MRNVFFSFHYDNDVNRANVVRNSWVIRGNKDAGFIDKAEFEKIKAKGDKAVYDWIDEQLSGTSVTAVLIGEETSNRKFIRYELQQSYCAGYYKYEKKQSSIHDIRKELYIKICDEYLTLDGCLEAPIYSFS